MKLVFSLENTGLLFRHDALFYKKSCLNLKIFILMNILFFTSEVLAQTFNYANPYKDIVFNVGTKYAWDSKTFQNFMLSKELIPLLPNEKNNFTLYTLGSDLVKEGEKGFSNSLVKYKYKGKELKEVLCAGNVYLPFNIHSKISGDFGHGEIALSWISLDYLNSINKTINPDDLKYLSLNYNFFELLKQWQVNLEYLKDNKCNTILLTSNMSKNKPLSICDRKQVINGLNGYGLLCISVTKNVRFYIAGYFVNNKLAIDQSYHVLVCVLENEIWKLLAIDHDVDANTYWIGNTYYEPFVFESDKGKYWQRFPKDETSSDKFHLERFKTYLKKEGDLLGEYLYYADPELFEFHYQDDFTNYYFMTDVDGNVSKVGIQRARLTSYGRITPPCNVEYYVSNPNILALRSVETNELIGEFRKGKNGMDFSYPNGVKLIFNTPISFNCMSGRSIFEADTLSNISTYPKISFYHKNNTNYIFEISDKEAVQIIDYEKFNNIKGSMYEINRLDGDYKLINNIFQNQKIQYINLNGIICDKDYISLKIYSSTGISTDYKLFIPFASDGLGIWPFYEWGLKDIMPQFKDKLPRVWITYNNQLLLPENLCEIFTKNNDIKLSNLYKIECDNSKLESCTQQINHVIDSLSLLTNQKWDDIRAIEYQHKRQKQEAEEKERKENEEFWSKNGSKISNALGKYLSDGITGSNEVQCYCCGKKLLKRDALNSYNVNRVLSSLSPNSTNYNGCSYKEYCREMCVKNCYNDNCR